MRSMAIAVSWLEARNVDGKSYISLLLPAIAGADSFHAFLNQLLIGL